MIVFYAMLLGFRRLRVLLCLMGGVLSIASLPAADAAKRSFDLPAGDAEMTLREFFRQSGVQIVFDVAMIRGVRTTVVQGDFAPLEALNRMFARTGFVAVQDEQTGALTIRRAPRPNVQRATRRQTEVRPVCKSPQQTCRILQDYETKGYLSIVVRLDRRGVFSGPRGGQRRRRHD